MSSYTDFIEERLNRASEAKNALLAKFKQAADPQSPEAVEKRRQREMIAKARAERTEQRKLAREEHERELARQAAVAAKAAAETALLAAEQAAREAAEEAERDWS